jgi:hypothetical protein
MRINPNDPKHSLTPRYICRPGRAVFAVTRFARTETKNLTPMVEIGVVCVKDPKRPDPKTDPSTDVGLPCRLRLYVTERGQRHWGLLAQALGFTDGYDNEIDDDVEKMLSSNKGVFIGEVKVDEGKWAEIVDYARYTGAFEPDWSEIIAKGEEEYEAQQQRRANSPKPKPRSRSESPMPGDDEVPF